jgi:hypothetical protein
LILGLFCVGLGSMTAVGDIWRLNNPESCDAAQLCTTFQAKTPTEISLQLYLVTVFLLFGIVLIGKANGGRVGLHTWMAIGLIPFGALDLIYHLMTAANITGIVQLGDRTDLNFNIVYDIMLLGVGTASLVVSKTSKHEKEDERPQH